MADTGGRRGVAVLGGGCGALTAVYGLTSKPGWEDEYDITVYQLGWRLGGKGASGRNREHNERIEEHGLHVWAGFYENAFRVMRECYAELNRAPDQPLATVWDAFKEHSYVTLQEEVDGKWIPWNIDMPRLPGMPGDGETVPSVPEYVESLFERLVEIHERTDAEHGEIAEAKAAASERVADVHGALAAAGPVRSHKLLEKAHKMLKVLPREARVDLIKWVVPRVLRWLEKAIGHLIDHNNTARRLWVVTDFIVAHIVGIIGDDIAKKGWEAIDDREWTQWLKDHGATPLTLESPCVRGIYDYVFGFHKGHHDQPVISAGVAVPGLLRLCCTYHGSIFYEMQAGMGDTVFTPLYEVLKKRGVKFEFFHRVKNLGLSDDRKSIAGIEMGVQATLADGVEEYAPLRDVKGLPCWPSEPHFDQLKQGAEIREGAYDLESAWTAWKDVGEKTLRRGEDFDLVILGISLAALPHVCPELLAASGAWRDMVENVQTVQTLALQLWLTPTANDLGWPGPPTIMTAYEQPFNTWADLSHLAGREDWPADAVPGNLSYLCGPLADADPIPPFSDHGFPAAETRRVEEAARAWLDKYVGNVWPEAGTGTNPDGLNWKHVVSQYYRANVNPTERYVLSVPGSTQYRLSPGGSGFDNLYLAGDWVRTPINAGCVEAAVMGGLLASQAICGHPKNIVG